MRNLIRATHSTTLNIPNTLGERCEGELKPLALGIPRSVDALIVQIQITTRDDSAWRNIFKSSQLAKMKKSIPEHVPAIKFIGMKQLV